MKLLTDDRPMMKQLTDERPLRLFIYRFWNPVYKNYSTLDSGAKDQSEARASATRFLRRENVRLRRVGVKGIRLPRHDNEMVLVG